MEGGPLRLHSIGFGNYDAPTQLWGMPDGYPSLFLRKKFTLKDHRMDSVTGHAGRL